MKGIYLCAYKAFHPNYNLDYNDIIKTSPHINIICDALEIDLSYYDFIIATPPCNYYSRANYRRETSEYSLKTKHLLPTIIEKCVLSGKPFIVENVRNRKLMKDIINKFPYFYCEYGRHSYFSNIYLPSLVIGSIPQEKENIAGVSRTKRQGSNNVHAVIEYFLSIVVGYK